MRFLIVCLSLFCCKAFASDYNLGAGDQIQISVYGEPDLTTKVKIDKSGLISFPFLSDVSVLGLSPKLLEKKIADGLRGDYIIEPQVSVSIVVYRPFFIHGQVRRPGGYPFQEDLTLDKAIAIAGGLAARASKSDWKITRIVDGVKQTFTVNVASSIFPDDIIEIEQSFF
jgi:polysaccharide export outer membrane protein